MKMSVIIRPIIRKKRLKRRLDSEISFNAVWEQLEYIKNESNIKKLLNRAINENYYGLDLDYLKSKREAYIGNLRNAPNRFIEADEIEERTPEILASIKQASEYYYAAKESSHLTKPVFLYYGMVSLAKAVINFTYKMNNDQRGHGLNVQDEENFSVTVRKRGEFTAFHDCYMGDPFIYSFDDLKVSLKELLSVIPGIAMEWNITYNGLPQDPPEGTIPPITDPYSRFTRTTGIDPFKNILSTNKGDVEVYYGSNDGIITLPPADKHFIHVIDAHMMAMFILCYFARYRPLKWMEMLNNSESANSYLINIFLRRSELDFPILVFNEITAIEHNFSSLPRWV